MPTDREVAAAYRTIRNEIVGALTQRGFEAEWIEDKGAIYSYIETDLGRVVVYFPSISFGGLMSDRQRANAEAHAEVLAEQIRGDLRVGEG